MAVYIKATCNLHLLHSINLLVVHSTPINNIQNLYICRTNHAMQTLSNGSLTLSAHKFYNKVKPQLSESPLSKPSVIQTLFQILKSQDNLIFCKIKQQMKFLRLVRLISLYRGQKSILACVVLSPLHATDRPFCVNHYCIYLAS